MRRREFIKLISGAAAVWPLAARSQQPQRRVGVLLPGAADDPEMEVRLAAFPDELQQLGWTNGRNVRIDTRWDAGSNQAEELVAQAPDVILASTSASVAALQWITRSVPIAFANVIDPVGAGFVESLARPAATSPDLARLNTA